MDSIDCRSTQEEEAALVRHYEYLRSHRNWKHAKFIFIPENNYGMPDHLERMIPTGFNVVTYEDRPGRPGVYKDKKLTETYRRNLSLALHHRTICFSTELFTRTPGMSVESILALLMDQLESYHYEDSKNSRAFSRTGRRLTGKAPGKQDDLLITFLMAYTMGQIVVRHPNYRVY